MDGIIETVLYPIPHETGGAYKHGAKPLLIGETMNNDERDLDRFLGEIEVARITDLSRTTRWRLERDGRFPRKRHISANRIGWLQSEILEWMESRANTAPIEPGSGAA